MIITGERLRAPAPAESAASWATVESVPWPGRSGKTIDLVAVGPGGVLVVERKRWRGTIDVARGELRQSGFRRERECQVVVAAARALAATLPSYVQGHVQPVIALVDQPTPARQPAALAAVGVADLDRLMSALDPVLSAVAISDLLARLGDPPHEEWSAASRPDPGRHA
jgi:Nuclease-related domain